MTTEETAVTFRLLEGANPFPYRYEAHRERAQEGGKRSLTPDRSLRSDATRSPGTQGASLGSD